MRNLLFTTACSSILATGSAFAAIDHDKDAAWHSLVQQAERQSADENRGRARVDHRCFPNTDRTCRTSVFFTRHNGEHMEIQRVTDFNGNTTARLVCKRNNTETILNCEDFDDHTNYLTQVWDGHNWVDVAGDESTTPNSSGTSVNSPQSTQGVNRDVIVINHTNLDIVGVYSSEVSDKSWGENMIVSRPCGRIPENIGQGIPESLFR
jgi:hypothetical protein